MKKKNIILIAIVAVLLIIAGTLIGNNRYLSSLRSEASDFTVYDTATITKLFFADKSGNKVVLERNGNSWMVNDEFVANQGLVNEMLYTLTRMRIKMPVSVRKSDNVVTRMATTNIKVEVYQNLPRINLFNKVKLFYHETRSKVFYVGGVTQDNVGTYVLKEGGDKVYVAHLPMLNGSISARFSANPIDWRTHIIFNDKMDDIASVKLEINKDPNNGFIIKENGRYQFAMSHLDGTPIEFDTLRVLNFMTSFKDVRFEAFLNDVDPERRDSIINSPFMQRLTVTTKDGRSNSVTTFSMLSNADMFNYNPDYVQNPDLKDNITDPDHKYALLSENNEFVLIQDFVFGKLLKPAFYYSKDYKEEIPQVYYKELETVESR